MNEFALIDRYFRRDVRDPAVRIGIGDDAAVVAPAPGCELAIAVDMLVEGRHFLPDVDPASLGHKTLAVNLSDMAAIGATPRWALLAGALPDNDEGWLAAFAGGLFALALRHRVELIGGDTTRGPRNLCLTIVGELPAGTALTRAGARVGDDVLVSGRLGDAALALAALAGPLRARCGDACRAARPPRMAGAARGTRPAVARRGVGRARRVRRPHRRPRPHSRGFGRGCRDRARADSLRARARAAPDRRRTATWPSTACLPAATTTNCASRRRLRRGRASRPSLRELSLPLTRIGAITAAPGLRVRDEHGVAMTGLPQAFDHFR